MGVPTAINWCGFRRQEPVGGTRFYQSLGSRASGHDKAAPIKGGFVAAAQDLRN
jgi:hypothetical protein